MAQKEEQKSVRCLIVESNESLQCLVHSWLTAQDISHVQVYNGEMAVAACQQYRFETIFLDLDSTWDSLVENGIAAVHHIRTYGLNERTPIVGWTGQVPHPPHVFANAKLFSFILTKPFCKEDVLLTLAQCRSAQVPPISAAPVGQLVDLSVLPSEFPSVPLPPKSARVLVVEDCKGTQRIIAGLLRRLTDNVMQAFDGDQAVLLCSQWHYDIVFMDIHMPTVNGIFATSLIRSSAGGLNIYTPIIAFTSSGTLSDYAQFGMNDLLSKPFTTDSLRDMFDKWTPFSKKTDSVLAVLDSQLSSLARPTLAPLSSMFDNPPVSLMSTISLNVPSSLPSPLSAIDTKTSLTLPTPSLPLAIPGAAAAAIVQTASPPDAKMAGAAVGPWPRRKKTNPVGHTVKEKQRRASIVHSCNTFRTLVPNTMDEDKASVFRKAVDYLSFLRANINKEELARVDKLFRESARSAPSVQQQSSPPAATATTTAAAATTATTALGSLAVDLSGEGGDADLLDGDESS